MQNIFIYIAFLVAVYMVLLFVVAVINKRNDIADVGWGLGFVIVALVSLKFDFHTRGALDPRGILLATLVVVWGLRLATHIYIRFRKRDEDPRYKALREEWGSSFYIRSFLEVFLLQGFLLFLISFPIILGISMHNPFFPKWLDIMGTAIWIIGFLFETVGDAELAKFLKDPANKGHLMTSGLWSLTRHPNYFGEVTQWWGVWLIALSAGAPWWTVIGPLTITYLITHVSGIPMTEARQKDNPEFAAYKARVSRLIPLYPGKKLFGSWKKLRKENVLTNNSSL